MDNGVVIGEGVLLDTRPASFAPRMLGALIDMVVLGILAIMLAMSSRYWGDSITEHSGRIVMVVILVTFLLVIPTALDTLWRGRTLGRWALGIRIVRDDGGPIRFRQALVRALVGVLEIWFTFGSVALITSMLHPRSKRIGDVLAGTYAIRVRGKVISSAPILMPPGLARWAVNADMRRLPDGLALAVRQFLGRAPMLHPGSRIEMGSQLSAEVGKHVAPLPPPGTHPEAFLAAVIAERRRRETAVAAAADRRHGMEAAAMRRLPYGVPDPS